MKKGFTLLAVMFTLFIGSRALAQTFAPQHDTMYYFTSGNFSIINQLNNTSSSNDTIEWKIMTCDWTADILPSLGACDVENCYPKSLIWPTAIHSAVYAPGAHDFRLDGNFAAATSAGPYTVRVRFNNKNNANDTAWETFIVSKVPVATPKVIKAINTDVTLYPNPASNTLNVVYDASADIKNVAIYSIIGKQTNMFRVTDDNSASLNIENIPSGIYFVRLINSHGDVMATRKFTKQ